MSLISEWQDRYNKAEASLTSGLMNVLRKSGKRTHAAKRRARKEHNQRLLQANALDGRELLCQSPVDGSNLA